MTFKNIKFIENIYEMTFDDKKWLIVNEVFYEDKDIGIIMMSSYYLLKFKPCNYFFDLPESIQYYIESTVFSYLKKYCNEPTYFIKTFNQDIIIETTIGNIFS